MKTRSERIAFAFALLLQAAVPGLAHAQPQTPPTDADDALSKQRNRFQQGMDRYRAGAYGEAILIWSEIYRALGTEKGYRLAFNLGRAYEQVDDATRAAEHYEAYLDGVRKRREASEAIEELVAKQEEEAKERMNELRAALGKISFRGAEVLVVIDADVPRLSKNAAYVTAGKHTIKFRPSTVDEKRVEINVAAEQSVEIDTPSVEAPPPPVAPPPAIQWETRIEHPYPKAVMFIGAGATTLSLVLPIVLYANATGYRDEYNLANGQNEEQAQQAARDYASARSSAYASWAVPALLGTATVALAAYWFMGKRTVRTPMSAGLAF